MVKYNSKKSVSLLRKKNEGFDGFRDIERIDDLLDILSPDTRRKFQQLDAQTQDYYLSKLSKAVDWDTEDADEIDAALVDIMRFESFCRRKAVKKESQLEAKDLVYDAVDSGLITARDIVPLLNQHQLEGLVADFDLDYLEESCKRESRIRSRRRK